MKLFWKWLSYPKSILATALSLLWTLFWSLLAISGSFFIKDRWFGDFVTTTWGKGILFFFNIRVKVEHVENLVQEDGLFLFNHASLFDIPVIFASIPNKSIRFGAKAELFRIPFFGSAMKGLGMLMIHRAQRDKVLKLYQESLKNVGQGYNYILAPEGTRQENGQLGPFKSGPFIMAISGQIPIFPLVLVGANKILPKKSLLANWGVWRCGVTLKVLPAIETKGLSIDQRDALKERVRTNMLAVLK